MIFLILLVIVFNLIAILIPKRISGIEILTTTLFSLYLETMANVFLDLKYDLYGYFTKGVNWASLLYVLGVYPPVNIVYLNYFPYKKQLLRKVVYILLWSVFAYIFEFLFLKTGTFYYNGWKFWYSVIIYPLLYLILVGFHKFVKYLLSRYQQQGN
ncbi:CBO0543 family protein [Neobacillus jeddahensis]|uniref:CBO0543 family protein n=1 Tax=Neobacillus jeddahensis TaxID=1461580 RepID=UPI00058F43B1|nr:CBO0543 family protein [Neobacillus jeddahensis]